MSTHECVALLSVALPGPGHSASLFVCFDHRLFTPVSTPREWIFACTAVCNPVSRAVVLRLRGDLTCMVRICLYRREAIKKISGGLGMSVLGGG